MDVVNHWLLLVRIELIAGVSKHALATLAALLVAGGCSSAPSRIPDAVWDPDKVADQAIADLDKDGDGLLSSAELKAAPGLKDFAGQFGTDGDRKLSREDILERLKYDQEMRGGLTSFACQVTLNGKPLGNATVKLVPEPFLGGVIKPAVGVSSPSGIVQPVTEEADIPAVRLGMYRIEITSPDTPIPEKYNTQTTLGVEVSGMTNPAGNPVFHLKSSRRKR